MSEWWTYRLSDLLLFSGQTYYRLLESYNREIWPLQVPVLLAGIGMLWLAVRRPAGHGRVIAGALALAWLWVAWGWHLERHASINPVATAFAVVFALQALLLVWFGLVRDHIHWQTVSRGARNAGLGIFLFALVIYPVVTPLAGRPWTQVELAGIAPDPTALATLGLLVVIAAGQRWLLALIPFTWCLVSTAVLHTLGSPDAFVPLALAMLAVLALLRSRPDP